MENKHALYWTANDLYDFLMGNMEEEYRAAYFEGITDPVIYESHAIEFTNLHQKRVRLEISIVEKGDENAY